MHKIEFPIERFTDFNLYIDGTKQVADTTALIDKLNEAINAINHLNDVVKVILEQA